MTRSEKGLPAGPCAQAYWRPDKILIHALARTEQGFYIMAEPWLTMPSSATHAVVGSAIREALLAFQPSIPVPDYRSPQWKALKLARFRAVGVESERQFVNGSKLVGIKAVRENLHFTPTRNDERSGPNRGYRELPERMMEAPLEIDAKALGLILAEAWAHCA